MHAPSALERGSGGHEDWEGWAPAPLVPGGSLFSSPKVAQESDINMQERAGEDPSYFFP